MKKRFSIRKLLLLGMALALCLALAACNRSDEPTPPADSSVSEPPAESNPAPDPDPAPSEPEASEPDPVDEPTDVPEEPAANDVNDPDVAVDPPVDETQPQDDPEDPVTTTPPAGDYVAGHVYSFYVTGNTRDGEHRLTYAVTIEDSATANVTERSIAAVAEKVAANFDADVNICSFYAADADPATDAAFATVELKKGGTPEVTAFTAP